MRVLVGNMDKIVQYENRGEMLGYFDKDSVGHGCFDGLTLTQPTIISAKFLLFCEKAARLDKVMAWLDSESDTHMSKCGELIDRVNNMKFLTPFIKILKGE